VRKTMKVINRDYACDRGRGKAVQLPAVGLGVHPLVTAYYSDKGMGSVGCNRQPVLEKQTEGKGVCYSCRISSGLPRNSKKKSRGERDSRMQTEYYGRRLRIDNRWIYFCLYVKEGWEGGKREGCLLKAKGRRDWSGKRTTKKLPEKKKEIETYRAKRKTR